MKLNLCGTCFWVISATILILCQPPVLAAASPKGELLHRLALCVRQDNADLVDSVSRMIRKRPRSLNWAQVNAIDWVVCKTKGNENGFRNSSHQGVVQTILRTPQISPGHLEILKTVIGSGDKPASGLNESYALTRILRTPRITPFQKGVLQKIALEGNLGRSNKDLDVFLRTLANASLSQAEAKRLIRIFEARSIQNKKLVAQRAVSAQLAGTVAVSAPPPAKDSIMDGGPEIR